MMRALWTGASGMISQQTALDTISNNISNINTTGYKKESTQFQSLLYQKLQTEVTDNNGDPKPVIGQVGSGTRVAGIISNFESGSLQTTGGEFDFALEGEGFFMVRTADGTVGYTRNGAFGLAIDASGTALATPNGYQVLNSEGNPVIFGNEVNTATLQVDEYGTITYTNAAGETVNTGHTIGRAQFNNPAGLEKMAGTLYRQTDNSGEARVEGEDTAIKLSKVISKCLESSNVSAADEMVDMIVTQRAYEMNSKIITAADEMLQQANNLRA